MYRYRSRLLPVSHSEKCTFPPSSDICPATISTRKRDHKQPESLFIMCVITALSLHTRTNKASTLPRLPLSTSANKQMICIYRNIRPATQRQPLQLLASDICTTREERISVHALPTAYILNYRVVELTTLKHVLADCFHTNTYRICRI